MEPQVAASRLIIVGAGGCGREVAQIASDMIDAGRAPWTIAGFLDDNPDALAGSACGYPVLGGVADWQPAPDERFVLAIGTPATRALIAAQLAAKGAQFASVIHPSSRVAPSATVGVGVVIYPYTYVSVDVVLGDHVQINMHNAVGHDARIGDYSVLSSFCDVTGYVRLGERVLLGSHVTIAPGLSIGDDALVGLGSVVVAPVRAGKHVFGNPAKTLKL